MSLGFRSTVSGTFDTAGIRALVDAEAARAVTVAAERGGEVARVVAGQRRKSGLMSHIETEPTRRTELGWMAAFFSPTDHAWHQTYGTLGNRAKRLRRAPQTSRSRAPGTGVKPLFFMQIGLGAGRQAMASSLGIALRRPL